MTRLLNYTLLTLLFLLYLPAGWTEELEVIDDIGRVVRLDTTAGRIVSLAPHITENLFAAGAGELIVGVVSYSDYPEEAKLIPRVGTYNNINTELILAAKPDLVIAWKEGNQKQQIEKLMDLGLRVYINAPDNLEDIATDIRKYGMLSGHEKTANTTAEAFIQRLELLRTEYSAQELIPVFYQTWHKPLLTVNSRQFIGQILELCGGMNIFADLGTLTPQVSIEAVLKKNPHAIIASGMGVARPEWLDEWRTWQSIYAVQHDNLFFVPPDIIQRVSPRLLDGAELVCKFLQEIRNVQ